MIGPLQWVLTALWLSLLLAAAGVSVYTTYCIARDYVRSVIQSEWVPPRWLADHTPLRGKWLRLALAAPVVALMTLVVSVVIFIATVIYLPFFAVGLVILAVAELLLALLGRRPRMTELALPPAEEE